MLFLCLSRRQHAPLLPNLVKLRMNRYDGYWEDLLPFLLMGSQVKCLAIAAGAPLDKGKRSSLLPPYLFATLPDICPNLTQLEIPSDQPESMVEAAVHFSLRSPRLEAFVVFYPKPWSREFLCHLASQLYLRKVRLSIGVEDAVNLTFLYHQTIHYPFPALEKLWLEVPSISSASELLRMMQMCRFHTLDLQVSERIMPEDLLYFFHSLRHFCLSHTLQVLLIGGPCDMKWSYGQDDNFFFADLEPVLVFTRMRRFKLAAPLVTSFDNGAMKSIADAWPLLVDMCIGGYGFLYTPSITWSGLGYLLWKCPEMEDLAIAFNSTVDDLESITSFAGFRPNRSLRHLYLQDSILGDVDSFAENLFAIAPLTVGINGHAYDNEELGIFPMTPPGMFYPQVEKILWELRRTRLREQVAFLDDYGTLSSSTHSILVHSD